MTDPQADPATPPAEPTPSAGSDLQSRIRAGRMPLAAAAILTDELQAQILHTGGFKRFLRGVFTAIPMLITAAIGFVLCRPQLAVQWGLPLSDSSVEVAGHLVFVGAAVLGFGALALLCILLPWTLGRLLASGASYLLGLTLVLYLGFGGVWAMVNGLLDAGWIAIGAAMLCLFAPSMALNFARGEVLRAQLRAMLAAGEAADRIGLDLPGGLKRAGSRLLLILPVLFTGIAVLLWLGAVRGLRPVRCVCLGAIAFLNYLTAIAAAQFAMADWAVSFLGHVYRGGGAAPEDLDATLLRPAVWILAAGCLLTALAAAWTIAREISFPLQSNPIEPLAPPPVDPA